VEPGRLGPALVTLGVRPTDAAVCRRPTWVHAGCQRGARRDGFATVFGSSDAADRGQGEDPPIQAGCAGVRTDGALIVLPWRRGACVRQRCDAFGQRPCDCRLTSERTAARQRGPDAQLLAIQRLCGS
jgi:hypothetical protein